MAPRLSAAATPLAPVVDACLVQSCKSKSAPFVRSFSSTPCHQKMSRARQQMYQWLKGREGSEFADPKGGPRYLGPLQDQPFPLNPLFRSQPVLDEHTRELIWDKVMGRGESLKAVSAEMGVDVRRVAAVVRLKEVEKQWQREVSFANFFIPRFPFDNHSPYSFSRTRQTESCVHFA